MAVKVREEQPERDNERPRRAALFSRKRLARQQSGFEQFVAWLLLIISFVGSLLIGGGGVSAWGVALLAGWQVPAANAPYLAGGLIALSALLIDIFPEQTLTA